jgi:hypothetical protein
MKHQKNYNIFDSGKAIAFVVILLLAVTIGVAIGVTVCHGEDQLITCYAICKPGSHVNIHMTPSEDGVETGYLECGDSFQTDANDKDGWIPCYGAGEGGWVYVGYVSTEPVREVGEQYVCVAKKQVACRRWCNGPQIKVNNRKQWLKNGQNVDVFCIGGEWAVTSKGYIRAEWLEVDPR